MIVYYTMELVNATGQSLEDKGSIIYDSTKITHLGVLHTTPVGSRGTWTNFPLEDKVEVH